MSSSGRSLVSVRTASSRWIVLMPEDTRPKIVCLPSRNGVGACVSVGQNDEGNSRK
jgi:hypothetical protein